MPTALTVGQRFRSALAAVGLIVRGSSTDDPTAVPTITSGSGAPSAAEPNGSLYLRSGGAADTTLYSRVSGAWVALENAGAVGAFTTLTATTLTATTAKLPGATELTIASGVITATQSRHYVDTEGDAASDNLDTIEGGSDGMLLVISPANDNRTVVLRHLTGNLRCPGATDITLAEDTDHVLLMCYGTQWIVLSKHTQA